MSFTVLISAQNWLMAVVIFVMVVTALSLDTFRILFLTHGYKRRTWIIGFFELLVFISAIGWVLSNLDNMLNVIGYAAGYATGNLMGMLLVEHLSIGHIHIRIISSNYGLAIASSLRANGFAVTETAGRGRKGTVSVLHCGVMSKDVFDVKEIVQEVDSSAFVVANEVRSIQRGFWHIPRKRQ